MLSRLAQINFGRLHDFDLLARMFVIVFAVHSILLTSTTWRPTWDEMNYLHRAVCVNRTLFEWDWRGVHGCMLGLYKSPVLMLLLLPFGQIGDNIGLIRVAPFTLAIFNFSLLLVIGFMTWRLRVPLAVVLVAAIAMAGNPLTHVVGGAVLIDTSVSLVVTIAVLLFAFEISSKVVSGKSAAGRGVFWGMVGTAGVMSKMTFGFFAILLFVPLAVIVWHREGSRYAAVRMFCCFSVSIPGLIVFALYGNQYFWNALRSSIGPLAEANADNLTLWEYTVGQFTGSGLGGLILLLMAAAAIATTLRRRAVDWTVLYLLLVLIAYFWLVSSTVNRQVRFLLPFWLAMPWCLALVMRGPAGANPRGAPVRDFALAGLVSVFLALPSLKNYDLSSIELSRSVLRTIPADQSASVMTATDSPDFNIESLLLAYELDRRRFPARLFIDTLVYDGVNGRTLEQSLARLRGADVVLFRIPLDPAMAAYWPNARYEEFLQIAEAEGREIAVVGPAPSAHVYVMPRQPR